MRLGWFGGSFDPPHSGHFAAARAAADAFALDEILLAPVGHQPLKGDAFHAAFHDRLAMVELLCREDTRFTASTLDAPRPDGTPNYTVSTLTALQHSIPTARLFGIVGMDAFLEMPRWRGAHGLLELADWIVVTRPGHLQPIEPGPRVHLLEEVWVDVSATALRRRLRAGLRCDGMAPEPVLGYIAAHALYR